MTGASIKVKYNFDLVNDNGTQNVLTDDTIEIGERILELPIGGVKINHFKKELIYKFLNNWCISISFLLCKLKYFLKKLTLTFFLYLDRLR